MSDDQITIERHGDGHAVYSGRVYGDYDPGDGSFFAGSHGNRLFNVTDATEAGLRVAHEMVAAVNALPELLERVKRYEAALNFYAAREHYNDDPLPNNMWKTAKAVFDGGKRARAALNQEGGQ